MLGLLDERLAVPIEELSSRIEDVRRLISSRLLTLHIVEYPWGVEFEVGLRRREADYYRTNGSGGSTRISEAGTA